MSRVLLAVGILAVSSAGAAAGTTFVPRRSAAAMGECRVVIATRDGHETRHPCGQSIDFPPRGTTAWIEQGTEISTQVTLPVSTHEVSLPLVRGVLLRVSVPEPGKRDSRVLLLHDGAPRFTRSIAAGELPRDVLMPGGRSVVLLLDSSGDVTRVAVAVSGTANVRLLRPDASALTAILSVPELDLPGDAKTELLAGGHGPDAAVQDGDRTVAVWTRLEPGATELSVRSSVYGFEPVPVRLRAQRVATVRGELRVLPSLTIDVHVPEEAGEAWKDLEPSVAVRRAGDQKMLQERPALARQELRFLPAAAYEVVLHAGPWRYLRKVDLSTGGDGAVQFDIEPVVISGTVTYGDGPAAAQVTFRRGSGDAATVAAGPDGAYEVTLWTPGMYVVETTLDRQSFPPFTRLYRLSSTRRLDVRVPRTDVTVRVTDAASGKPVQDAEVITINDWNDETGPARTSHRVVTDETGRAKLAPMNPGTAEIHAAAPGYFKDDPLSIPLQENGTPRVVEMRLRRAAEELRVRILLPDGAAAAGAEVLAVSDPSGQTMLWSGRAGDLGEVLVPRTLEGAILLVRHPAAAGLATRFRAGAGELRLPRVAAQPVVARVEHRGAPAPSAHVTVWFGEIPLSSAALEFLLRGSSATSGAGLWSSAALPAGPLRMLASTGRIDAAIATGSYDALAAMVPDPRPGMVVLQRVD